MGTPQERPANFPNDSLAWVRQRLSVVAARGVLAAKAAARRGVLLPIGIGSLDELGHHIRIEELTLDRLAQKLASGSNTAADRDFWTGAKNDRARWLEVLSDEATQWVIVASYVAVKVRADRARSVGLALGLLGAVSVVVGYISLQPGSRIRWNAGIHLCRQARSATSDVQEKLGPSCDVFTAVPLDSATPTTLYVTGGARCRTGRFVLKPNEVLAIQLVLPPPPRPPRPLR